MDEDKQQRLADNFRVRELLGLMPLEHQEALYAEAARLMEWDEEDAEEE
tara:strand:- start:308 stop:454 length:147 start_codon:yes stop_codon:yes gene_type:complete